MNVLISKLNKNSDSDKDAARVLCDGSAYELNVCVEYVTAIRNMMDFASWSPLHVVMADRMGQSYWNMFGVYFEALPTDIQSSSPHIPTQLKLYDVHVGPSKTTAGHRGSCRLLMLADSEVAAHQKLIIQFPDLGDNVTINYIEVEGPFSNGFVLCKVDRSGREEFNGIYRDARD